MISLDSKHGPVLIFAQQIDQGTISQVLALANSPLGRDAHIRIMPDAHVGKGCVIGTTMRIHDKVCPNLVGVDIGCGVDLMRTDIDFAADLPGLDALIRQSIPYGMAWHDRGISPERFASLRCWPQLKTRARDLAVRSLGTLGGGNHFIEAYAGGFVAVHSGSRNIGGQVADHYQQLASRANWRQLLDLQMQAIEPRQRAEWLAAQRREWSVSRDLCYLTGAEMADYLHDLALMQQFASDNRRAMLDTIVAGMGGRMLEHIQSVHNYVDIQHGILRKGAISARQGERLVIPLNMRDGMLICVGRGNPDWNHSAPHGAGRLYSRSEARRRIDIDDFRQAMRGVYSTCVDHSTIDESPFAYKDASMIIEAIQPTAQIVDHLRPIYNFKASES